MPMPQPCGPPMSGCQCPAHLAVGGSVSLLRRLGRRLLCALRTGRPRAWPPSDRLYTGGVGGTDFFGIFIKTVFKVVSLTRPSLCAAPTPGRPSAAIFDEGVSRTSSFAAALFIVSGSDGTGVIFCRPRLRIKS